MIAPTESHLKLSLDDALKTEEEKHYTSMIPYSNAVGSLMFVIVCTRPDLAYSVSMVHWYMSDLGKVQWQVIKKLLRYLRGTSRLILFYENGSAKYGVVKGFVNSNFDGDVDKRKSLIVCVFTARGSTISWKANLWSIVVLFSTKAEYIAEIEVVKKVLWLQGIIKKLRINQKDVVIHCNNQSALNLMKNHIYHERTKQINAWMNFIQEIIAQGSIIMKKIWIKGNTTNMLTKVFLSEKFRLCQSLIGAVLEERKLVDRTWRFMTQVWSSLVKLK